MGFGVMGKNFLKKNFTPIVCIQNDQRVMGIILRCVCWGTPRPPPPRGARFNSVMQHGGIALLHPLNVVWLYVPDFNCTCTHWVSKPKDPSMPNLGWPSGASYQCSPGRE